MTASRGSTVLVLGLSVAAGGIALQLVSPSTPPTAAVATTVGIPLGGVIGAALFLSLSRGRGRLRGPRPASVFGAGLVVAATGAGEEAIWRGFALARLVPAAGVTVALAATTVGFAATHVPAYRARGLRVHTVTGATFGVIFVATGSLCAAAVAHASYNLLVAWCRPRTPLASAVSFRAVDKRFGELIALSQVDLDVAPGEVVALLGPNGAGKTTLCSLLLGLRRPDVGLVELFGRNPRDWRSRTAIGATPQEMSFPPTLRVHEILTFVRRHYPAPAVAADLLGRFGLAALPRRQVGGLSGGEKRRLAVMLAFAGSPQLVVLDEPTTGLDVESRRGVWAEIKRYAAAGGTVLLTTHNLEEAETLSDRVVVIARGAILADGTSAALRALAGTGLSLEEAFLRLTGTDR